MRVILIAAMTADGFIARHGTHAADWTSKADKQLFVRITKEAGVILMGSRTFATIGKALPGRRMIVYTSRPETISIPEVEVTNEAPVSLVRRLQNEGVKGLAVCGGASIYDLFMRSGVVDELYLTVEPKLFGQGVGLFANSLDINLILQSVERLGQNSVLLQYRVADQ